MKKINKVAGLKRKTERIKHGDLWAIKHTYKFKDKVLGIAIKNPYTDKYEARAKNLNNNKYIKNEFDTLDESKWFILHNFKNKVK